MREDAIRFVKSVYKWRYDHEDADKKTASKLAAELFEIEASKLPSGAYGLALLQVQNLAYGWYTAPIDGMNDEELSEWLGGKDLAGLLEQLVLHGGEATVPPATVSRSDLVNRKNVKGLLDCSTSRLSQLIATENFPKPILVRGRKQTFDVSQVNEWLESKGKNKILV